MMLSYQNFIHLENRITESGVGICPKRALFLFKSRFFPFFFFSPPFFPSFFSLFFFSSCQKGVFFCTRLYDILDQVTGLKWSSILWVFFRYQWIEIPTFGHFTTFWSVKVIKRQKNQEYGFLKTISGTYYLNVHIITKWMV